MNRHADFDWTQNYRQQQLAWCQELWRWARQPLTGLMTLPPRPADRSQPPSSVDRGLMMRPLYQTEVVTLQTQCRCQCLDWSALRILIPMMTSSSSTSSSTSMCMMDLSPILPQLVSDNKFSGVVILVYHFTQPSPTHSTSDNEAVTFPPAGHRNYLPPGIHSNLLIANSILHLDAKVYRNGCITNTLVDSQATLFQVSWIGTDTTSSSSFRYQGLTVSVGAESGGGRPLHLTPESTLREVTAQLGRPGAIPVSTTARPEEEISWLGTQSIVQDTCQVVQAFLYPHAAIQGAARVHGVVLFPHALIQDGARVQRASLQWKASITASSVTDCLLMEEAHVGPQSICASSVIGPDVHSSAGEVHASVVGPNTNAHHQSLLIGVLWPLGRGNVGYGANVGSNHTGRLPDQECVAGEGVFWGLSTVIKFPVDLSSAPYTVVAAGTQLPPQRITMPFSLIVTQDPPLVGRANQLVPGWVLRNSPYTLARSEKKYATRRQARRHMNYTGWKILRPETVELCRIARQALQMGPASTDGTMVGAGECFVSPRAVHMGIRAYTECIQLYALQGLLQYMEREQSLGRSVQEIIMSDADDESHELPVLVHEAGVAWNKMPWDVDGSLEWSYQRTLLVHEFPVDGDRVAWTINALRKLMDLQMEYADRVLKSKKRDDDRGAEIVPGYADFHIFAEEDPVTVETQSYAADVRKRAETLIDLINSEIRSKL